MIQNKEDIDEMGDFIVSDDESLQSDAISKQKRSKQSLTDAVQKNNSSSGSDELYEESVSISGTGCSDSGDDTGSRSSDDGDDKIEIQRKIDKKDLLEFF